MRKLGKIALQFIVFNTERRKVNILLENHAVDGGKYTRKNTYQEKFIWPGNMKKCTVSVAVKERELEWHAVRSGRIVRRFQRSGSLGAGKSVKKQLLSHTSSENANEGNMKNVGK